MTNRTQPETPVGAPLGDTGDGNTGVPNNEQGISNRPGDRAIAADGGQADDDDDMSLDDLEEDDLEEDDLDDTELNAADDAK